MWGDTLAGQGLLPNVDRQVTSVVEAFCHQRLILDGARNSQGLIDPPGRVGGLLCGAGGNAAQFIKGVGDPSLIIDFLRQAQARLSPGVRLGQAILVQGAFSGRCQHSNLVRGSAKSFGRGQAALAPDQTFIPQSTDYPVIAQAGQHLHPRSA